MNIGGAEETRGNAELRRFGLHIGIGRLDGLFHDVFEVARDFHRALACHGDRFDGQDITANRCPCEARDDTDLVFCVGFTKAEFLHAKQVI